MDQHDARRRAIAEFDRRIRAVPGDRWDGPTPCSEWTVRDLVAHLVVEQLWVPPLLSGATIDEVGDRFDGDQLGSEPVAVWLRAIAAADDAWSAPGAMDGMVHTGAGIIPAREYGWQMIDDMTVHAWDLAVGIDADRLLDPELVNAVHADIRPHIDDWRHAGLLGPAVPAPRGATEQEAMLAWLGRRS